MHTIIYEKRCLRIANNVDYTEKYLSEKFTEEYTNISRRNP